MRVLLVEDEADLARAVRQAIAEDGFAVDVAGDGEAGLWKALAWDYDAIVLDLMLPKLDGWTVLERLRTTKRTPVLVLTARDAVADRVRGLDGGADDYLVKPFDVEELLARLRALVRRAAGVASSVLPVADLELDTASRTVRRAGVAIPLTAKEYAVFERLAMRRGRIVTRTELYDHVYDESDPTLSNVIDVYVASLRRKLGRELIETRRGQGYLIP